MNKNLDIKKLFGKRVKELRQKKNISQEQLAEMIDVVERNVSNIECGNNFVTAETLQKIAIALDSSPKSLFDFNHLKDKDELKKYLIQKIETMEIKDLEKITKFIQEFI